MYTAELSAWGLYGDRATAIAVQGDGAIVVGGIVDTSRENREDFAVVRLLADGSPDPAFASAGVAVLGSRSSDFASFVHVAASGHVIIGGTSNGALMLARVDAAGVLDPTFGVAGLARPALTNPFQRVADATADGAGRLILVGEVGRAAAAEDYRDLLVARVQGDGALDPGFAGGAGFHVLSTGREAIGRAVALEPDGRILVAGEHHDGHHWGLLVARFTADGLVDSGFGVDGQLRHALADGSHEIAALLPTASGLALVGAVDGVPLLARVTDSVELGQIDAAITTTLPFPPVAAGAGADLTLTAAVPLISSRAAPMRANVLTVAEPVTPAPGTPTAVFVQAALANVT